MNKGGNYDGDFWYKERYSEDGGWVILYPFNGELEKKRDGGCNFLKSKGFNL